LPQLPNVVLLVFDTMRRDALRAYGGTAATPNFDSFCGEAMVYPNCISPSPWTIPSHVSLFSGKYPSQHGVHETRDRKVIDLVGMPEGVKGKMLAESLKGMGYQTVGFPANPMLTAKPGFDRGFDSFSTNFKRVVSPEEAALVKEAVEEGKSKPRIVWKFVRRGQFGKLVKLYSSQRRISKYRKSFDYPRGKGGNLLLDRMRETKLEPPYFLFANFMETHDPYVEYELDVGNRGPFPSVGAADLYGYKTIGEEAMRLIKAGYYSSATRADECFGKLISLLKEKGVYENTLVVVTSDHGQALMENGYYGHGTFLHEEILAVPLLVRHPRGVKASVGEGYQNLVDIPSYILRAVEGETDPEALSTKVTFAQSFGTQQSPPAAADPESARKIADVRNRIDRPLKAVSKDGWTLLADGASGRVEGLFRGGKRADPKDHPSEVEAMMSEFGTLQDAAAAEQPVSAPLTQEEESSISERLRELGYL